MRFYNVLGRLLGMWYSEASGKQFLTPETLQEGVVMAGRVFTNRVGLLLILVLLLPASCVHRPDILGTWREAGKTATIEFHPDGTFRAVDNEGMAVAGRYHFFETGSIRFEVQSEGTITDVVNLRVSIQGDEMTLVPSDGGAIETYRKDR
jgi:hypothetical protein